MNRSVSVPGFITETGAYDSDTVGNRGRNGRNGWILQRYD